MTVVGAGGIAFDKLSYTKRFKRELKKLDARLKDKVHQKIRDLKTTPFPAGLAFEKLKGYSDPDIYTIHVDGNYKLSIHIQSADGLCTGVIRRVGTHNEIDRRP